MTPMYSSRRLAGALVMTLALVGCSPGASTAATPPVDKAPASSAVDTATPPAGASAGVAVARALPDFSGLVERFGPAVVNVQVTEKRQEAQFRGPQGMSPNDPFYDFFRRFGQPNGGGGGGGAQPRGNQPPQRGEGSGFVVSPDGFILTNAHVVNGATEVTVKLVDRREYRAKVIGVDTRTDVAVIKIEATGLPTVRFGDPGKLKPGQWVIAIGSPFGMVNSVTAGIVSATSRSLPNDAYVPFIQTDVAVNPGNSGGPLFNMEGEVVGINSQIYSQTGGYMGLSFAIPIDVANGVREQLVKFGKVSRGKIGIGIQPIDATMAEGFGLDRPRGALVGSVEQGGPADKAGVKPGDVITKIDGKTIELDAEVPALISNVKPGQAVQIEVWRDRTAKSFQLRTAELVQDGESPQKGGSASPEESSQLGLSVRPLQPQEKQQVQTEGTLVVEDVSGPAEDAGVQPGDILLGVGGKDVKSLADLQAAAKKAGKVVPLRIQRGERQIYLAVRVPEK
ncbi:MAG: Do family serine endopeptidase [Proteobacteria bacterium]|nr:MAG: Do family serine endopeptidase [Pseudomonadota bacterium]